MKEDDFDELLEKYKKGKSSLNEENLLFDSINSSSLEPWVTFVKNNKIKCPKAFNDTLWNSFERRTNNKRKIKIALMSAAASVFLLILLFVGNLGQNKLNDSEKKVLLDQAIDMFICKSQTKPQERIIYENELLIIYTSVE